MGHLLPEQPVWKSVAEMCEATATRDYRFSALRPEEAFAVELSILSPMKRIRPADIRVGTDGLYVKSGTYTGLLLPQVAVDWGWNAEDFLQHTCQKAGLPPDACTDPLLEIYSFTTERFSEESE